MTDEERAEKAKTWDPRTPSERYDGLTQQEKTAFRAFFRGGRCDLQMSWRADIEKFLSPSFGKSECEWVPIEFWKYKLTGLRFIEWREEPPRVALGMHAGGVVIPVTITVLADGLEAYEAARQM